MGEKHKHVHGSLKELYIYEKVCNIYTLSKQGFFSLLHQGNIVHKLQATCEQHANLLVTLQQQARHIAR